LRLKLLHIPRYDVNPFEKEMLECGKLASVHHLPPLGIATLTAVLRKRGFFVDQDDLLIKTFYHNLSTEGNKQIDLRPFNDYRRVERFIKRGSDLQFEAEIEKLLKLTKCDGFDVFGFSLYETTNPSVAGIALTLGKLLKEKFDATIIIGGDVHKEVVKKLLRTNFIDCAIWGESTEEKLINFCEMFELGVELKKIPGIVFSEYGKIVCNPFPGERKSIPPRPDFDGLPLRLYKPTIKCTIDGESIDYSILVLPYFFIHGCPYGCAFCPDALGGWAAKKPEKVVEDLRMLSKKYRTRYFFFINTNINPTRNYAEKLVSTLIKEDLNLIWSDCASFQNMDKILLQKLRCGGAIRLVWGLESASPKILHYIRKPIPVDYAISMLKGAHRLGIWNELDLICGFPYETEEDIELTVKFIRKNAKYVREYHLSKFRADGDIRIHPEKYKIRLLNLKPSLCRKAHFFPFEEIEGLSWEGKMRQIDYSYQKLKEAIDSVKSNIQKPKDMSMEEFIYIHFIYWWKNTLLAAKFWDKKGKVFLCK
jgi:radical SAM superfamily enzyme YgiQ (UPF0313 family)